MSEQRPKIDVIRALASLPTIDVPGLARERDRLVDFLVSFAMRPEQLPLIASEVVPVLRFCAVARGIIRSGATVERATMVAIDETELALGGPA